MDSFAPIVTARLVLREWRDEDLDPFAAMNTDPAVMQYLLPTPRVESDASVARIRAMMRARGFCPWAVEAPGVAPFIGFIGLLVPRFEAPFTPCVEVGWRLARPFWGRGYATEGARAALAFGFREAGLSEIVAMTVPANVRSRAVIEKLGMVRDPAEDFDHPNLPEGHPLSRHVLYRLTREAWASPAP